MRLKRAISGLLAGLLLTALLPAAALAQEAQTPTRGQVCEILLNAADFYNPGVTKEDILKGDETGALREDAPVTRAEAMVMLSRAFGPLPAPVGDIARWAYPAETFADLPAWAGAELANVLQAGILTGTAPETFSPNQPITAQELDRVVRRAYAVFGTNPKDDFYAAVNQDWLAASTIPAGQGMNGGLYEINFQVQDQLTALIGEVAKGTYPKGTDGQKIAALYGNILNWDARNKAGIDPIRPYLEAIEGAETLSDVMAVQKQVQEGLGIAPLVSFDLSIDMKDSSKYTVNFSALGTSLTKDVYTADAGAQKEAFLKYLTALLVLGGVPQAEAGAQAQAYYEVERAQGLVMLAPQEQGDVDKIDNRYTMKDLKALFPQVDLDAVYAQSGLKAADPVGVTDPARLKAAAAYFTDEHVDTLKTALRVGLLSNYSAYLSQDFQEATQTFQQEYAGVQGAESDEQIAASAVQSMLSTSLEKLYVEKYFTAEAKADVEAMIADMIEVYRDRIKGLDWMSETTKAMALKKLDTLGVKVGYPDQWDERLSHVEIRSVADGGSYFENVVAMTKASRAVVRDLQGKPVDKSQWICPAFTVNAFYNATANDITFPAAILQAPMYDVKASREANLGGIGYVIAHEITHAFDNNGAKFDEKGNAVSWWTESDYAAFQDLCGQAVAYYDGAESIPGVLCNGTQTLSENVADLGGAACVSEIVRREDGDFAALFTAMAKTWALTSSRPYAEFIAQIDVHAASKLRGYMPAQTQAEFYEVFEIQPGDGMWLDPEDRVSIW